MVWICFEIHSKSLLTIPFQSVKIMSWNDSLWVMSSIEVMSQWAPPHLVTIGLTCVCVRTQPASFLSALPTSVTASRVFLNSLLLLLLLLPESCRVSCCSHRQSLKYTQGKHNRARSHIHCVFFASSLARLPDRDQRPPAASTFLSLRSALEGFWSYRSTSSLHLHFAQDCGEAKPWKNLSPSFCVVWSFWTYWNFSALHSLCLK